MTSVGEVRLRRIHFACAACQLNGYASDAAVGLEGYLSPRLRRLACLAAADQAFARSAAYLQEFCGIHLSEETLRLACEQQGQRMAAWQPTSPAVAETFRRAVGEMEFHLDAGKANTLEGWRDLKLACFAKRPLGKAADVTAWDQRDLPTPTARTMFAAIAPIEEFQGRFRPQAVGLGLSDPAAVHALGDGAEWIWNAVDSNFPRCRQTLDIYHGCEHVSDASKALYQEGTSVARASFERGRALLLAKGWPGICDYVAAELAVGDTPQRRAPLEDLTQYFAKHVGRLDYRQGLAEGRAIGSGLVEGSIKTVGLRVKARGARWRLENVDKMAGLCCLRHSTFWDAYWRSLN
jgi:hypothetical protein